MRCVSLVLALLVLALANDAFALQPTYACDTPERVELCLPERSDNVIQYPLTSDDTLIAAHDPDATGAYNPAYRLYLLNKNTHTLVEPWPDVLVNIDVDTKNLVLASFNKGRGPGDIGRIEFYRIDLPSGAFTLLKRFHTLLDRSNDDYINEDGTGDKPCGYILRAKAYTLEMRFQLSLIESLTLSDFCL